MERDPRRKYQQPYSIKINEPNEALREYLIYKEHRRQKFLASKQSRRLYNAKS